MLPVEIVTRPAQLGAITRELAGARTIALDTESNSFHHYPEQLCLIQIASRHKVYIIDTISLYDLAPLRDVLADVSIKKVVHAADNDIRSLDRHCGLHIHNLFDTSIAARFTGITQFGLAALTRDLLGITINKSKRLQRTAWGRRPLSPEAIEYAATDVRHLIDLREVLDQRLRTLGREVWVAEECARIEEVRYTAPKLETAYLSIKGVKDLDERGLAILKSLFLFREEEARRQHRPPFFVLPDATLIFLATSPEVALSEVPVGKSLNEKIDVINISTATAYELKASGKNAGHEFYKDIFKVIVYNQHHDKKLERLVFITEKKGIARLSKGLGKAVSESVAQYSIDVTLIEL